MNPIKRLFPIAMLFLILVSITHGISFTVEVTPIKNKIDVEDVAEFDITVNNLLNSTEEFNVRKAQYPFWDMYTKPLQNPITIVVPPKGSATIRLYVDPQYITNVDTYTLEPMVSLERTREEQRAPVTVGIKSTSSLIEGYKPSVIGSARIDPENGLDPRQEITITISLNNQNLLDYPNITIKVNSRLINDEIIDKLCLRIDEIELSVRSTNCLSGANIETIAELVSIPERKMLEFRNFGKKSLTEIGDILKAMGLTLGMKVDTKKLKAKSA